MTGTVDCVSRRHTIIEMHRAGHSPATIHHIMKYPRQTISDVIKRYQKTGAILTKRGNDRKPRKDKILTPKFLYQLKRSIKADPSVNQSVHAKKKQVSNRTIGGHY